MPRKKQPTRKKQSTTEVRDLQKQVKKLQQAIADLEAQRLADIEMAAETGYELACIEAEEKELRRAAVVAEAVLDFEKTYESKAKTAKAVVAKKATKRRGRPAKNKKRAKKVAAPAEESTLELPAPPVPETGDVSISRD